MTDTQLIREMMTRYNAVIAQIEEALPKATEEEVRQLAGAAMNTALGI